VNWRDQLDEILPEPGVDLAFLDDPEQVEQLVERAMSRAARRTGATFDDLAVVLNALLWPTTS
jgi:cell division ATPase FtsA